VTSDEGPNISASARIDPATGRFRAVAPDTRWDVDAFGIAPDGSFIAYVVNEAGISRLQAARPAHRPRSAPSNRCPPEPSARSKWRPGGDVGFTLTSATSPADAYSVNSATLADTRWTRSETGGLDPEVNAEPELDRDRELRRRAHVGLSLSPGRGPLSRAADR
jgi:hypothetical protein